MKHINLTFVLPSLVAIASFPVLGAVECRVVCPGESVCVNQPFPDTKGGKKVLLIKDCDVGGRKLSERAAVWYYARGALTRKVGDVQSDLAQIVKDADGDCRGVMCLRLGSSSVPGGSPIGSGEESSSSSGAKAGLPFGTILVPSEESKIMTRPASQGQGEMIITSVDDRGETRVPIVAGVATLRTGMLREDARYAYTWSTNTERLDGSFKTASAATASRLNQYVLDREPGLVSSEERSLVRAQAAIGLSLRWTAMQILQGSQPER